MTSDNMRSLFDCKSNLELARYFNIEHRKLTYLAYRQPENRYITFRIPKRKQGEYRTIDAPRADLKRIQRTIAQELWRFYYAPICTYGFVSGRNIAQGAKKHVKKRTVMTIDLQDFFSSVSSSRVRGIFITVCHCCPEVANTLTNLTCLNGGLPQGAPSSPILSNLVCYSMDRELLNYAIRHRLTYSRYADDLTFSSTSPYLSRHFCNQGAEGIEAINRNIRMIVENENSFAINPDKIHIRGKGSRQTVTGIIVNNKCNFTRETYRGLRVLFHNIKCKTVEVAVESYVLKYPQYRDKLIFEDQPISREVLFRHIRGRLVYYTMITSVNHQPSSPLIKLWTMYYEATKESVPLISLDYHAYKTTSESAYFDLEGKSTSYQVDGSAVYVNGYYVTCRHCITDATKPPQIDTNIVTIEQCPRISDCQPQSFVDDEISCQYDYDIAWCKDLSAYKAPCNIVVNTMYIPQIGEEVIAVGYEGGSRTPLTIPCKVSFISRDQTEIGVDRAFIHGMSGGPIFNQRHELIGILRKGSSSEAYYHNGAFIPIKVLAGRAPFPCSAA